MIPGLPVVRNWPISNNPTESKREKILAHRDYSGYGSGLIFVIEAYQAEHPEELLKLLLKSRVDTAEVFEREFVFDGLVAQVYQAIASSLNLPYTRRVIRFATAEHVYLITLATLEPANPSLDQFLSSLRLRRPDEGNTSLAAPDQNLTTPVLSPAELSRKAIIVWKAEPTYTDDARSHRVVGKVILDAVMAENGYVANITVKQALEHGLTEAAIEAVRSIRFFPAEKDGKPVSQSFRLEYNFDLY